MEIAVSIRLECERVPVRRPVWLRDVGKIVCKPRSNTASDIDQPEDSIQIESDGLAVGRYSGGDVSAINYGDIVFPSGNMTSLQLGFEVVRFRCTCRLVCGCRCNRSHARCARCAQCSKRSAARLQKRSTAEAVVLALCHAHPSMV